MPHVSNGGKGAALGHRRPESSSSRPSEIIALPIAIATRFHRRDRFERRNGDTADLAARRMLLRRGRDRRHHGAQ